MRRLLRRRLLKMTAWLRARARVTQMMRARETPNVPLIVLTACDIPLACAEGKKNDDELLQEPGCFLPNYTLTEDY